MANYNMIYAPWLLSNNYLYSNEARAYFGPYSSLPSAISEVLDFTKAVGFTIGVIEDGKLIEYWWNGSSFVKKYSDSSESTQINLLVTNYNDISAAITSIQSRLNALEGGGNTKIATALQVSPSTITVNNNSTKNISEFSFTLVYNDGSTLSLLSSQVDIAPTGGLTGGISYENGNFTFTSSGSIKFIYQIYGQVNPLSATVNVQSQTLTKTYSGTTLKFNGQSTSIFNVGETYTLTAYHTFIDSSDEEISNFSVSGDNEYVTVNGKLITFIKAGRTTLIFTHENYGGGNDVSYDISVNILESSVPTGVKQYVGYANKLEDIFENPLFECNTIAKTWNESNTPYTGEAPWGFWIITTENFVALKPYIGSIAASDLIYTKTPQIVGTNGQTYNVYRNYPQFDRNVEVTLETS